ncbi:hypothetical protein DLM45_14015 [Hyphomicrobium methylovorum]|uniref:DUF2147 domain-containing protein n=1 Tax=Hyphomicrobium methylovorum TaxID=84 RepID=UPI0015E70D14|nr:DUF2147 domain-containing protein [Hyphomicrobium methylovorum]MBA2127330.1 hypothetical protein [Hyphomicrobium methylovorum]
MSGMKLIASACAVALLPAGITGAAAANDPIGIWLNDTGRGAVEIKKCGDTLCGHVVWVKDTSDSKGCGKQIIGNVASVGGGRWDNGWIYSPERGRRYNVEITPLANGTLRVTGYAGMRFLSKTMVWKRAPDNLERCDAVEAKAAPTATPQPAPEPSSSVASVAPSASNAPAAETPSVPTTANPPVVTNPAPNDNTKLAAPSSEASTPPVSTHEEAASTEESNQETASAEDNGPDIAEALNGLGLGKVITKTKSGKCKLDLPWVKVTLDCDR